jgi:pimeloyl-ACP methyl ester carboxylesterase
MRSVTTFDDKIKTPNGEIFYKTWKPVLQNHETPRVPLILLHDSLGSVELWRDFPEQLCQVTGKEIVAYDRIGFGKSDAAVGQIKGDFIRGEANGAFSSLIEHLNLNQFILFGHSVGGGMAVACAARYPDRCKALITESAQALVEDLTLQGIRDAEIAFRDEKQFAKLVRFHGDKTQWVLDAWIKSWLSDEFKDWSLNDILPKVSCPLLSLHGENDEFGSMAHPNRFSSLSAGPSKVVLLANCGHVPHREMPTVVLDHLTTFLASL